MFPEAPEDDILKVVGNLLYYRYMNPAIVAPGALDVVDMGMDNQLSPDQVGVWCGVDCAPSSIYITLSYSNKCFNVCTRMMQ